MKKQLYTGIAILVVFVIGAVYIVMQGRPVVELKKSIDEQEAQSFSLEVVQSHNTPEDCWATINGDVYDLTTWISRHPGGPTRIEGLCGTDGSDKFNRKHGKSNAAQGALVLLKIGKLAN